MKEEWSTLPRGLDRLEVAWVLQFKGESLLCSLNDGKGRSSKKREPYE